MGCKHAPQWMSQTGEQRQQAQRQRQPPRPLAAVKTPGRAQHRRRRGYGDGSSHAPALAAAPPAAATRGTVAAAFLVGDAAFAGRGGGSQAEGSVLSVDTAGSLRAGYKAAQQPEDTWQPSPTRHVLPATKSANARAQA